MKAIIADRNPKTIDLLRKMLHKEYKEIEVVGYAHEYERAFNLIHGTGPDLILMEMAIAFQGTKEVLDPQSRGAIPTIFMTTNNNFDLSQLTEGIATVLLKPIESHNFKKTMNHMLNTLSVKELQNKFSVLLENVDLLSNQSKKIIIKDKETIHAIRISEVLYCEADGGYTLFHLKNHSKIIASKGLKVFSAQLERHGFYRIHHSFLVNQTHIARYNRQESILVLENGASIPVSVRKRENLEALLSNRLFL